MLTVPVSISAIEWLGDLADEFESSADEKRLYFRPESLRHVAFLLRRVPFSPDYSEAPPLPEPQRGPVRPPVISR